MHKTNFFSDLNAKGVNSECFAIRHYRQKLTDISTHREQVLRSKVWATTATNDSRKCSLLWNTFSMAQGQSKCLSFLR